MRVAKIVSFLGIVAMGIAIGNAFINGDFSSEGSALLAMPWGVVSLVDLYVGFSLFAMWIIYREKEWWQALIWVVLLMVLGFFIGSLYTFLALMRCDGDWYHFWHGKAKSDLPY